VITTGPLAPVTCANGGTHLKALVLEGRFTVADLLMTTVLRIPRNTTLVQKVPGLDAYRLRCEGRPALKKALNAQMAVFTKHTPPADRPDQV
jgi:glutathione S-transferase